MFEEYIRKIIQRKWAGLPVSWRTLASIMRISFKKVTAHYSKIPGYVTGENT